MFSSGNRDFEAAASLNPCSQLSSWGDSEPYIYTSTAHIQNVHAGKKPGTTGVLQGEVWPRCWAAISPLRWFFHIYVQMQTPRITLLSLCCMFPWWGNKFMGGLYELFPGRSFLNMGLTKHSSIRQWVSVSLHRNSRPSLQSSFSVFADEQTSSVFADLPVLHSVYSSHNDPNKFIYCVHFKELQNNIPDQLSENMKPNIHPSIHWFSTAYPSSEKLYLIPAFSLESISQTGKHGFFLWKLFSAVN